MADIKTMTEELADASLDLTTSINEVGDLTFDNIKLVLEKMKEKIDELVNKVNNT
tara:strand:+ start:679 stop:843 length:165 start_codon:yes stop_codon:yes gene_type:complete